MAAIDIVRSRERGVMRYNELRRALRLTPAQSFEDITSGLACHTWAQCISYAKDKGVTKRWPKARAKIVFTALLA